MTVNNERTNKQEKQLGFNHITFFSFIKRMDLHSHVFLLLHSALLSEGIKGIKMRWNLSLS